MPDIFPDRSAHQYPNSSTKNHMLDLTKRKKKNTMTIMMMD